MADRRQAFPDHLPGSFFVDRTCIERYLDGEEPVALADDLLLIPVPGHTPGSICLLYRRTFLFTGDHLWWSPVRSTLSASRAVNWYSWKEAGPLPREAPRLRVPAGAPRPRTPVPGRVPRGHAEGAGARPASTARGVSR